MLKKRILTAVILIPLFIGLLFFLTPIGFCIATGLIMLCAAWEWSFMIGIKKFPYTFIFPMLMLPILFISLWIRIPNILWLALVWWLFAGILVLIYPKAADAWGKSVVVRGLMGIFVLLPCWLALNFLRNTPQGIYILLFLFVLIWGADSAAYFTGKKFGKNKLLPLVSPGKTWEGLYGALLCALLISCVVLVWLQIPYQSWISVILLALITVIFSVLGDLFESMLKRRENLKDSGNLLPGHGGVLDRIDSLTAAAPIFVLGLLWLVKT